MPTANQILKDKTVPEMTNQEIQIVMNRAKDAWFERHLLSTKYRIDMRKRSMGKWALAIFKSDKDFLMRGKIRERHLEEINYYLRHKELPGPTEIEDKVDRLLQDLEYEILCRKILNIDNQTN